MPDNISVNLANSTIDLVDTMNQGMRDTAEAYKKQLGEVNTFLSAAKNRPILEEGLAGTGIDLDGLKAKRDALEAVVQKTIDTVPAKIK